VRVCACVIPHAPTGCKTGGKTVFAGHVKTAIDLGFLGVGAPTADQRRWGVMVCQAGGRASIVRRNLTKEDVAAGRLLAQTSLMDFSRER